MNYTKEEVFQLFVGKLSGTITPSEEGILEDRLLADPVLREEWMMLEEKALQLGMRDFLLGLDAECGLEELKAQRIMGTINPRPRRRIAAALSIAAISLAALAGVYLLSGKEKIADKGRIAELVKEQQQSVKLQIGGGHTVELGQAHAGKSIAVGNTTLTSGKDALQYTSEDTTMSTLSVPPGTTYKIVLSDGTEVWLNAATRLRFPLKFPRKSREVEVEGEAYFKIAKNANAPFVVHTPLTDVKVLGTSFNVNTYEKGNVRTALVEGMVITQRPDGQQMSLTPGYVSEYEMSKGFSSTTFEQDDELSWINGIYYFHDMTIENLVKMASRCYGIHIVFDKEKFAGQSLTGLLERNKLSEFLNDLEVTAHIKYYYSNKDLFLE